MKRKKKYPEGGTAPKQPTLEVNYNLPVAHTRHSIYPELVKQGIVNADSLDLNQWLKMKPEDTLGYIDPNKGFDYTVGNTANPGGIKYWNIVSVPNTNRFTHDSSPYYKAKKNTKYSTGGSILEGASTGVSTFAALAPLIGGPAGIAAAGVLGLGSMALGLNRDKKEKQLQATNKANMVRDEQEAANAAWQGYMAMGGLTPNGTAIEVEDGEVMRGQDGSMVELNGPTHEQGGIDVTAEPGSQVFGNLKIKSGPYKGMEFKEAASLIRQKITRLQNKLNK